LSAVIFFISVAGTARAQKRPAGYVNPFIGTTNFGTTNPGAVCPNGLMSVVPFNVMGSDKNKYDKDKRWWSTPYEYHNKYFTGYAHVALSGVGCPDLGSLLVMPTSGPLEVDYHKYGSSYSDEKACPGYYSNYLSKYGILTEVSATTRTSVERYHFGKGENHILMNIGQGLTNESGAMLKFVSPVELEGFKLMGTFCYCPQAVFPMYFVMRVSKVPFEYGYWKKQRKLGAQAQWDTTSGKYKIYKKYDREIAGDDIGAYFTFRSAHPECVEVKIGVSFVSMENARENLRAEQKGFDLDSVKKAAFDRWNADLSRIMVEGGTDEQKTIFYTALYHCLLHPNVLQDYNGEYPAMESGKIIKTSGNRYTVFSLWDTYRNLNQLLTLVYPMRETEMIRSMIGMYRESGWMPKWELYGRETYTMEGDPATIVIADAWLKGLRDFDINTAYEAMQKSAFAPGAENPLRPDNDDYMKLGYVPLRDEFDNSVSHALEYYMADYALSQLAYAIGHKEDAAKFRARASDYEKYYSPEYGTLRPILPDGSFYKPFDPLQGRNFEPSPGFHEGDAWNYTFDIPYDIKGLSKMMGGKKKFVSKLQSVFDKGYYDPSNEPDIAYPYFFSRFRGEEWRTQKEVKSIIKKYYKNAPDGIPGNDDTGTMSAWLVFSMMGIYPDCPGSVMYTLTAPSFDRIIIQLDGRFYKNKKLIIEKTGSAKGKTGRISHEEITSGKTGILKIRSYEK
jgi:predicted alpha-1,2-mannosidase